LYEFEATASKETKDFVGWNTGVPINNPNSSGMLKNGQGLTQSKCHLPEKNVSASVPYFNTTVLI